jgi:hypothetical protein
MKGVVSTFILLFAFSVLSSLDAQTVNPSLCLSLEPNYKVLRNNFLSPPLEAKMRVFWIWQNGVATKKSITEDLEAMKANGIGGAILCDNGADGVRGAVFMSDAWKELFAHVIKEATRLGLEISLNIQSGMGDPGNPNITPENSFKHIVYSETPVRGGKYIEASLPSPPVVLYYKDIAVQAIKKCEGTRIKDVLIKNWSFKSFNKPGGYDVLFEDFKDSQTDEVLKQGEIIDLTAQYKDDKLKWNAPAGDWIIIRYGMTSTGKRNGYGTEGYSGGLCYDHIHPNGVTAQWKEVAQPLVDIAKQNGNSLKFVHLDSWEMGITNWTHDFEKEFKQRRGYDITPYLPVLTGRIVGNRDISNRFLEDYRQTIGDLVVEHNYAVLARLAHQNGISLHSENAGPHIAPVDGMRNYNNNDVPMGEFWPKSLTHRTTEKDRICIKMGASATHIYEKRFFASEGPTIVGPIYERAPQELKSTLDKAFYTGVNRLCWHTYTSSPDEYGLPGIEYFAGVHLNRHVTWWKQSKAMVSYIDRCQELLSAGLPKADVLGYIGSGVPLYGFLDSDRKDIPQGYQWDMCNSDVLVNRATVRNGRICLPGGTSYAMLALSDQDNLPFATLKKIEQMVKNGMVLVGNAPKRSFGLRTIASESEFRAIVARLWSSTATVNRHGKGRVYQGVGVDKALAMEKIRPDMSWTSYPDVNIGFAHRSTEDADIYFLSNKWLRKGINDLDYHYIPECPDRYVSTTCTFRVSGRCAVERWDPMTGKITPVLDYIYKNGCYTLPVSLTPEGSVFYVFRKTKAADAHCTVTKNDVAVDAGTPLSVGASRQYLANGTFESLDAGTFTITGSNGQRKTVTCRQPQSEIRLVGSWLVRFNELPQLGTPFTATFDSLKSWTEDTDRNVKYFSGTATYKKTFTAKGRGEGRVYVDLGNVQDLATIRINGKTVATRWMFPFRADITDYVQNGENTLEVDVTNLWVNRLIGDQQLPKTEKKTWSVLERGGALDRLKSDACLRKSGLLGPVVIQFSTCKRLK